ncbi:MAG TPA: 2,3,4,5-tetrahydropyridine-2,6-dicarboxylate N-succinyltransferase [Ignavibacteria bacterium]|nr:2,3,4,5-tetrahydropyridine-2,6-dicarboxylate N-succinyltransferase [Ignavibacteria bacterium]
MTILEKYNELKTKDDLNREDVMSFFPEFLSSLEIGNVQVVEYTDDQWIVNAWVKEAILLGFKFGELTEIKIGDWKFFDKNTLAFRDLSINDKVRIVPGGSIIRSGAYVAGGTIIMPPSYINIGAYVDEGSMIDSHALVGSCARIGKNVHLSAASQIGGVLEPVGALPVIIEDNVFIGGNCGIYEGTVIKKNAVIGTGVILNASTPVFDNVNGDFIKKEEGKTLVISENAVVVAGSRPVSSGKGVAENIHLYCPVIIKYRDDKTGKSISLEDLLR